MEYKDYYKILGVEKNASQDDLSGFLNRRAGQSAFHGEIGRGLRENTHTALLLLDLDGFKQVNDTLGHDWGDKLLARITQQIRSVLREYDYPIRWGGDEFCIVLPNTNLEQAGITAEKVLTAVRHAAAETDAVVTASRPAPWPPGGKDLPRWKVESTKVRSSQCSPFNHPTDS